MDYDDTILSTYLEHSEPHDDPEDVVDTFVRLANSLLGPQLIDGERRELTPDDIGHQTIFENVGAVMTGGDDYVGLCINYRWWDHVSREAQFVLLLHEITHIEQSGHAPAFWETSLDLYKQAREQYALVETLFGQPFDWDRADWLFVTMADVPNVEFDHECVPERRQRLATNLGYTEAEFDAFELTADRIHLPEYDYTETVPLADIQIPPTTDTEIYSSLTSWLTRDNADVYVGEHDDGYQYVCEPPTVKPTDDGYDIVVGENRLEFLARTLGEYRDDPTIPVRVNTSEKPS